MRIKLLLSALVLFALGLPAACGVLGGRTIMLSGTLEMTEHSLGARVAGRIARMRVDEGSRVKKGALIAALDRFDQTLRDYERIRRQYEKGGASRQALELARLDHEDQQVTSPVEGIVLVKVLDSGEVAQAGGTVAVIGETADRWVRVYVPEGFINRIALGAPARVRFDGLRKSYKGRVSTISPRAEFTPRNVQTPEERVTQTFAVKVRLEDPDAPSYAGVSADVTLKVG